MDLKEIQRLNDSKDYAPLLFGRRIRYGGNVIGRVVAAEIDNPQWLVIEREDNLGWSVTARDKKFFEKNHLVQPGYEWVLDKKVYWCVSLGELQEILDDQPVPEEERDPRYDELNAMLPLKEIVDPEAFAKKFLGIRVHLKDDDCDGVTGRIIGYRNQSHGNLCIQRDDDGMNGWFHRDRPEMVKLDEASPADRCWYFGGNNIMHAAEKPISQLEIHVNRYRGWLFERKGTAQRGILVGFHEKKSYIVLARGVKGEWTKETYPDVTELVPFERGTFARMDEWTPLRPWEGELPGEMRAEEFAEKNVDRYFMLPVNSLGGGVPDGVKEDLCRVVGWYDDTHVVVQPDLCRESDDHDSMKFLVDEPERVVLVELDRLRLADPVSWNVGGIYVFGEKRRVKTLEVVLAKTASELEAIRLENERRVREALETLKATGKVADLSIFKKDRRLGNGSYKTAYTVKGIPELAVLQARAKTFEREKLYLDKIKSYGAPTIEYFGRIPDEREGWELIVTRRYVCGTKDAERHEATVKYANERTIADIEAIKRACRQGIYWSDVQFLIGEDGSFHVADPLGIREDQPKLEPNAPTWIDPAVDDYLFIAMGKQAVAEGYIKPTRDWRALRDAGKCWKNEVYSKKLEAQIDRMMAL